LKASKNLAGSFAAVVFMAQKDLLIGIRKNSPLVIGLADSGNFFASDPIAILGETQKVVYLEDETVAYLTSGGFKIVNFSGKTIPHKVSTVKIKSQEAEKGKYKHFMLKEIYEQPHMFERICSMYIKHNQVVFKNLNLRESFFK